MFNTSKLMKKADQKPSELEEEIAKTLQHFEQAAEQKFLQHLKLVFVNSAEQHAYKNAHGAEEKYILIRIPFRSLLAFRKVAAKVIEHLETKFRQPVIMVANRTIISPHAVMHPTQKRPRSRTLKAVHKAILDDIVSPSQVTGRQIRVTVEGRQLEKIFLDPMDREVMEGRLEALAHAYKALTTHAVSFEFSKPTAFQISKLEKKKESRRQ
jgi:small subunit ribosomal protein S7e